MAPRLRPLGAGDLLDTVFALYRRNVLLFAGVVAVIAIPQAIIDLIITLHTPSAAAPFSTTPGATVHLALGTYASIGGFTLAAYVISYILHRLALGALATAISARYLGRPITVGGAYRAVGAPTFLRLLLASILEAIVLIVAFAFLFIPFVYLYVRFLFIPQAIVLDRCGIIRSFRRSGQLVKGSWWRVSGIATILYILVTIVQWGITGVVAVLLVLGHSLTARLIGAAIGALTSIIVQPIELGGLTLLYYDLRIRKEGFDLEQMARDLERAPTS